MHVIVWWLHAHENILDARYYKWQENGSMCWVLEYIHSTISNRKYRSQYL